MDPVCHKISPEQIESVTPLGPPVEGPDAPPMIGNPGGINGGSNIIGKQSLPMRAPPYINIVEIKITKVRFYI